MTIGGFFSGTGGFELAGALAGLEPRWVAEIEPYCCKVLAARFPGIPNLGDVTLIDGSKIEPVDVITGGSPCQDMSVAGKQAGIHKGTRSSLFFHETRIIREMLEATNGEYPKYIVWENVPGALGSNKGCDFHAVLEEFIQCKDTGYYLPRLEKWPKAGCIMADDCSLAWKVMDAQFWGVPQRRKRIYLVVDLRTERAPEILFECEGSRWHPEEGRKAWEAASRYIEGCTHEPVWLKEGDRNAV